MGYHPWTRPVYRDRGRRSEVFILLLQDVTESWAMGIYADANGFSETFDVVACAIAVGVIGNSVPGEKSPHDVFLGNVVQRTTICSEILSTTRKRLPLTREHNSLGTIVPLNFVSWEHFEDGPRIQD